jgi:hypothetical protein
MVNLMFGDSIHPDVIGQTKQFLAHPNIKDCKTVCIEICSRKVNRWGDKFVNNFYCDNYGISGTTPIVLDDETILEDLQVIKRLLFEKYGITRVIIIPHINLPLRSGAPIAKRADLYRVLIDQTVCEVIDITAHILKELPRATLEEIMPDGYHYESCAYTIIDDCFRSFFYRRRGVI